MATPDPILNALASMEERLYQRMDKWRRELQLDLDGGFDAVLKRLDRLLVDTSPGGVSARQAAPGLSFPRFPLRPRTNLKGVLFGVGVLPERSRVRDVWNG